MNTYHQVFWPIFGFGCLIAFVVAALAGRRTGIIVPGILLFIGVIAFWAGLFIGSDAGYRAWQAIPDPPQEAYADTAPLGALIAGWFPGSIFCGIVFLTFRLTRKKVDGVIDSNPNVVRDDSGNPYQSPGA